MNAEETQLFLLKKQNGAILTFLFISTKANASYRKHLFGFLKFHIHRKLTGTLRADRNPNQQSHQELKHSEVQI